MSSVDRPPTPFQPHWPTAIGFGDDDEDEDEDEAGDGGDILPRLLLFLPQPARQALSAPYAPGAPPARPEAAAANGRAIDLVPLRLQEWSKRRLC